MSAYYEFKLPAKILSGDGALEHIPHELDSLGAHRPLLLSDQGLEQVGTVKIVQAALRQGGMAAAETFCRIPPDSSIQVVNQIAGLYRQAQCDSLIAVGGGSVIDTAKGVGMVLAQAGSDLLDSAGCEVLPRGAHVPFVAVPTTAGTGSEATLVAVVANPALQVKMEFLSYHLLPDVAVLDPRMTATLPPKTTASTGMDALCHAIEGYTCLQRNPASDGYAVSAIEIIRENLDTAVTNGKDLKARLAMANAAYLAGAAFSNSMVGLVHAIGHALGGVCHVPHGDAMTILLPHCMEFNMDTIGHLYGRLYLHLGGYENFVKAKVEDYGRLSVQTVRDMTARYHEFCNLPITLSQAGVKKEDFEAVARTALNDGAMIVNPKQVTFDDVIAILNAAY